MSRSTAAAAVVLVVGLSIATPAQQIRPSPATDEPRAEADSRGPSAERLALQGDAHRRKAEWSEALRAYEQALEQDDVARAHLGRGLLLCAVGRQTDATAHLRRAHELDPCDPEIVLALAAVVAPGESLSILEGWLSGTHPASAEQTEAVASAAEVSRLLGARRSYRVADHGRTQRIELSRRGAYLLVRARFDDGPPHRLVLDTGTRGILLHRRAAERSGIGLGQGSRSSGLGDDEPGRAHHGLAKRMTVGDLVVEDCPVQVLEKRSRIVAGADGILGTELFGDFLVRFLPAPEPALELSPLPARANPGDLAERLRRAMQGDRTRDGFVPVLWFDGRLFVGTTVNGRQPASFMLDSGANRSFLSLELARAIGSRPGRGGARGLSGEVLTIEEVRDVTLEFGGRVSRHRRMMALDLARASDDFGFEISGFLGSSPLLTRPLTINYRDRLVRFDDQH